MLVSIQREIRSSGRLTGVLPSTSRQWLLQLTWQLRASVIVASVEGRQQEQYITSCGINGSPI